MALPSENPARILVVEDEITNRRLIQLHLTALGYQAHCVGDAEAGLAAAEEETPDAIWANLRLFAFNYWLTHSHGDKHGTEPRNR